MIRNSNKYKFIFTFIFVILLPYLSLAQEAPEKIFDETPNQLSDEPNLQTTEEQTIIETDKVDSGGNGHNESTYYLNTRPADFIQVINTNGTIIFINEGFKLF